MRTNDCFNDMSLTMSLDVETNQWYDAEGLLSATADIDEVLSAGDFTNAYNVPFIKHVVALLKITKPSTYKKRKVFSLRNVKDAIDAAEAMYSLTAQSKANLEFDLVDFLFQYENPYKLTSMGAEVNLAGFYILPTSEWLGLPLVDVKKNIEKHPNYDKAGLESGYHCLVDEKEIDKQFKLFYDYHKPAGRKKNGIGLLVAHNISYEWNVIITKNKTVREWFKRGYIAEPLRGNGRDTIKAVDIKKGAKMQGEFDDRPVVIACRDTLMYSRSSLAKEGKKFNFPKGDLDYFRAFDLNEMKKVCTSYCTGGAMDADYENMLNYNRRDCSIPFCILNETFYADSYERILTARPCGGSKQKLANVPVSNNQVEDLLQESLAANVYEVVTGYVDKYGNEYDTYEAGKNMHKKIEFVTDAVGRDKKGKKMRNLRAVMKDNNKRRFGYGDAHNNELTKVSFEYEEIMINYNAESQMRTRQVSGGGLVGVNPMMTYKKITSDNGAVKYDDVVLNGYELCHCDLVSAHPSQVNKRYFPATEAMPATEAEKQIALAALRRKDWTSILLNPNRPFSCITTYNPKGKNNWTNYSGYAYFKLKNVTIKNVNGNVVPCMPVVKIAGKLSGKVESRRILESLNKVAEERARLAAELKAASDISQLCSLHHRNKVYRAKELEIACTFEDLSIYQMFYDFEIVDARDMYIYPMKQVEGYVWYIFNVYGRKKVIYKEVDKLAQKCSDIADRTSQALADAVQELLNYCNNQRTVLSEGDYDYITNHAMDTDLKEYTDRALHKVKGVFNGIYGQLYQSPFHEDAYLEDNGTRICEADKSESYEPSFNPSTKRNYLTGMYIAQWSRVDIALHLKHCINNNCKVIYWATDSIYYAAPKGFNVQNLFNSQIDVLRDQRANNNHLGGMDMEQWNKKNNCSNITGICTSQCLRIVVAYDVSHKETGDIIGHKIEATFSGADKDAVFSGCDSFNDYADRLCSKDFFISPFDNNKNQKKHNEDGTYNLIPQGLIINDSSSHDVRMTEYLSRYLPECFS